MAMKRQTEEKKNQITEGRIGKQLLLFFFPILFGTFFQQLYNAADAMIVGRFVGKEALSAVAGSTGMLTQMVVGFFVGLSSGAAVLVSQYYGAEREEMVGYAVHTFMAFSILAGLVMTGLGLILTPWMLEAMGTPTEVLDMSILYLRVYFGGIVGNLIYNSGAAILRAVGDSKRPLYFLISSCLINIVLDVLLVVICDLGVLGAALATILCQAMSAVMVIVALMRTRDMHHLEWRQVRMDSRMLQRMVRIGFPSGLQSVMYGISNVIIQSAINSLGTNSVAAWAAYSKIDSIFWMVVSAFGIAVTTFVGQNFGAGRMERVRGGIRSCMAMTLVSSAVLSVVVFNWGIYGFGLFTSDQEVVTIGVAMMRYLSPLYVTYVSIEILSGALRGVGDCWMPMLLCCGGVCVLRVFWVLVAVPLKRDMYTIMFSYPLTWVVTTILFVVYYFFFSQLKKKP
ncbi:MAG: MATE family efflux transporter [Lachnospiraceae bacterium]|nr:MATE family efflux transporter [Lachnospiraceae bacterium]MCI9282801.1 MATE family efflux transporter [Lachnospiraceae bacterium]